MSDATITPTDKQDKAPSPAPVASQPTALPTEPSALCQWITRWQGKWTTANLQAAIAATKGRDE